MCKSNRNKYAKKENVYVIIIIIIIKACWQHRFSWLSLSLSLSLFLSLSLSKDIYIYIYIRPYWPSFLASPLGSVRIELINVFTDRPMPMCSSVVVHRKTLLMCSPLDFQECQACLVYSAWMVCKIEVSGRTTVVLWGAASMICSKQHIASLYIFHLTFSPIALLKYRECNYTIILTQLQLERIPDSFYPVSTRLLTAIDNSSPCFTYAYVIITFSRWDIATEVYELIN